MRQVLEAATMVACGYEFASIATGYRLPPISNVCGHHPWLAVLIVGGLAVHLTERYHHYHERSAHVVL